MQKSYGKISNMIQILEELKKKFQKGKDFMYHELLCTSQLYKPENKKFIQNSGTTYMAGLKSKSL